MEVIRNIAQRRVRTTLTICCIAIGIMTLTVAGALAEHFQAQFAGGVTYYSSSIQVTDDAGTFAGVISLTRVALIQRIPGVAAALPTIGLLARPGGAISVPLGLPDTVGYTDPRERTYSRLEAGVAQGRLLDPNRQGEVVLGADMAAEFRVGVGDSLDLPVRPRNANPDFVNHTFRVVGILRRTNTLPDATAAVGLQDAQLLLQESLPASFRDRVDPSSLASTITVYGKPGVNLDGLADRINTTVPGVTATRPSDFVRGFDQSTRFTVIAALTAALSLLFGAVFVVDTMLVAVADRAREVGLKMLLGARAWHVTVEYLLEATLMGLAGGLLGVALGAGLAGLLDLAGRTIAMDVFLVTDRLVRIALVSAIALGAVAGIVPALRAARVDPDLVLRAS